MAFKKQSFLNLDNQMSIIKIYENFQDVVEKYKDIQIKYRLNDHKFYEYECNAVQADEHGIEEYKIISSIFFDYNSKYGYYYTWFVYKDVHYLEFARAKLFKYNENLEFYSVDSDHKIYEMMKETNDEDISIYYNSNDMNIYLKLKETKIPLKSRKYMFDIVNKYIFNCDIVKYILTFMYS